MAIPHPHLPPAASAALDQEYAKAKAAIRETLTQMRADGAVPHDTSVNYAGLAFALSMSGVQRSQLVAVAAAALALLFQAENDGGVVREDRP